MPPILAALRKVDDSFREVPNLKGGNITTSYINAAGFKVEASAQPLHYLDFLIRHPVRSALLHKGGAAVLAPAPERFAVHKLIVSELRRADSGSAAKAPKDLEQASLLIEALCLRALGLDLGFAWKEAWNRGPKWRGHLRAARAKLIKPARGLLDEAIAAAGQEERRG